VSGERHATARLWQALALLSCALFLTWIAKFYHPDFGFTELIAFQAGQYRVPALAALPHAETAAPYDGQFYAQLALEPLLRDPAIDRALDQPPYRARRILFSWTAWLAGFGKPWWVIQAYALQNVVVWLVLARLLTRWIPVRSGRLYALWAACMFSHGLLWSVRFALLDGPSMLLLAWAALAAERRRRWLVGSILGLAALGRETNLLGVAMFSRPRSAGEWLKTAGALALAIVPLLVWQDYLWSIYRTTSMAGSNQLTAPVVAYIGTWRINIAMLAEPAFGWLPLRPLLVAASLSTQAVFLIRSRACGNPWWRLALAFTGLMLIAGSEVWRGFPGAITRVVLPLTFGFNVLLASRAPRDSSWSFWAWYVLGNLHLIPAYFIVF
jgi:hypothetical protein